MFLQTGYGSAGRKLRTNRCFFAKFVLGDIHDSSDALTEKIWVAQELL